MPLRSFFAALEHFELKVCSQNYPKLKFLDPLDIQKKRKNLNDGWFWDWILLQSAPELQKMIGMACFEYLWCFTKSEGYADIKIIAIRCVDRDKIAKIIDHVQKSLWPLIFLDIQGDHKSEFWVVLRANFCFKVPQGCEKWSEWHVLGIYDVLQGQGVTLI